MLQALQQTWDYQVEEMDDTRTLQQRLSQRGSEGWELVSIVRGSGPDRNGPAKTLRTRRDGAFCAVFKRPTCAD